MNFYSDDLIELPVIGDENSTHEVSLDIVGQVIHARVAETLQLLAQQIHQSGMRGEIGAGFVLTGGLTKLEGVRELAMEIFEAPVRLAKPKSISGLFEGLRDPAYSTAIGLIMYSTGNYSLYEFDSNGNMRFNEESIKKSQIPNNISLDNISPKSFQKTVQQKIPERETPPIGQPSNINNQYNNHQIGGNNSAEIPQTEQDIRPLPKPAFQQPIEDELKQTGYYNHMKDNGMNQLQQNQNSAMSKMWQWVTQLF